MSTSLERLSEERKKLIDGHKKLVESFQMNTSERKKRIQSYYNLLDPVRGKKLPYWNWQSWCDVYDKSNEIYQQSPSVRSMVEKMISYVVSDKVNYSVEVAMPFKDEISDELLKEIKKIVYVNTSDSEWHWMQEQSIRRRFRDGEYFRWISVKNGRIKVRFIEPPEIKPYSGNDVARRRVAELFPFAVNYKLGKDNLPDYSEPQSYTYTPEIPARLEKAGAEKYCVDIPAKDIQHSKFGVDDNDPRGIGLGFIGYCQASKIDEVNEAMCELSIVQASYAVVRSWEDSSRIDVIDQVSRGEYEQREDLNAGRPILGQTVDAKGFKLELPGVHVNAGDFVEIISQQFRILGAILDMPEHVASAEADTGNRSSLISAEGPFDRRIRREQTELGNADVQLLWRAVESKLKNSPLLPEGGMEFIKQAVVIAPGFQSAVARDPDKQVDSQLKQLAARTQSRRGVIRAVGDGDPERVIAEIESDIQAEGTEMGDALDKNLSPAQRQGQEDPEDNE